MQLDILLFFQRIANPVLDVLMNAISMTGEIIIPLFIILFIYWCMDKKRGFAVTLSMLTALITTQIVKAIVRYPRPFMVYPELISGGRLETATGYSFPSGHSTGASSFYGSLAVVFRSWVLRVIAVILIIMVPVSRMYLGVHWPMDVLAGTIIGLFSAFFLAPMFLRMQESRESFLFFTMIYGAICFISAAISAFLLDMALIEDLAFSDFSSNMAIAAGVLLGANIEKKRIDFTSEGTIGKKAARYIVGLISSIAVVAILMMLPLPHYTEKLIAFFALGFWVTFCYPAIAVRAGLMERA